MTRRCLPLGLLLAALWTEATHAVPQTSGKRWCGGQAVPVFLDTSAIPTGPFGPCPFGSCLPAWTLAVTQAVTAWNAELIGNATGFSIVFQGTGAPVDCGECIVIEFASYSSSDHSSTACGQAISFPACPTCDGSHFSISTPNEEELLGLRTICGRATIVINLDNVDSISSPSSDDAKTILHELGHALGIGHDTEDGHLMSPSTPISDDTSRYRPLLHCLYGGGDPCSKFWVDTSGQTSYQFFDGLVRFVRGRCDCTPCSTSGMHATGGGEPLSYRFSISEDGELFTPFAIVDDDDFDEQGSYVQVFGESYSGAVVRMEVLQGGRVIDEAITTNPLWITGAPCPADVDSDGEVDFDDILGVLGDWGSSGSGSGSDVDEDGIVGFQDLLIVLGSWGPCGS